MSIDWSKAPEGATHWEPSSYEFTEGWMRKVGDKWSYWLEGSKVWGLSGPACCVSAEREATFEARPQDTWNGKGLPPVGTVCERRTLPGGDGRYEQVRIIAHTRKGFPVWENTDGVFAGISKFPHLVGGRPEFRPIRTPEQIAAEERAKAIEEMCFAVETLTVKQAKALFDAGYRRQEEGK
ncbi:TPA: hypothetical protein ONA95_004767 [Pseudomonas aeruginosa]|uniref:hypothetical protein n=1 Tax=Pseudomonas aeruginosa TaxID=287 RepID=UPI000F54BEA2|nr:hypothetical protein [Pseudomonas aeruginosa]RQC90033.1 hypothetical protein IPC345_24105 [Pseudomonas aeruginosa]HBO3538563.1 hypothetical protein [Pseudomonas aeruginosa]HBO4036390.1 hypothetical protein [Pseudomonas aeruginosa]HBO4112447.1 hypothetical protein [Pseudomonas aeruginosa]HCR1670281.1 hypothetical protein [Pseudomonas aeruginosa]